MKYLIFALLIAGCSSTTAIKKEIAPFSFDDILKNFCEKNYCEKQECPVAPECPTCPKPPACPDPFPTPEPTPPPQQEVVNEGFKNGNLHKPRSEKDGKPVILIRSKYDTEFRECKARLKNGKMDSLRCLRFKENNFKCFSNGQRQTWRANYSCEQYDRVHVVCESETLKLTLKADGSACSRHE